MIYSPFKVNISAVIRKNDTFLLVRRSDDEDAFPGYWGIPGGTVEPSDPTLGAALQRECMEEVGVTIKDIRLISHNIDDKGETLYLVYEANYSSGDPKALEGIAEVTWLTIDKTRHLKLTPMALDIIESCL